MQKPGRKARHLKCKSVFPDQAPNSPLLLKLTDLCLKIAITHYFIIRYVKQKIIKTAIPTLSGFRNFAFLTLIFAFSN